MLPPGRSGGGSAGRLAPGLRGVKIAWPDTPRCGVHDVVGERIDDATRRETADLRVPETGQRLDRESAGRQARGAMDPDTLATAELSSQAGALLYM